MGRQWSSGTSPAGLGPALGPELGQPRVPAIERKPAVSRPGPSRYATNKRAPEHVKPSTKCSLPITQAWFRRLVLCRWRSERPVLLGQRCWEKQVAALTKNSDSHRARAMRQPPCARLAGRTCCSAHTQPQKLVSSCAFASPIVHRSQGFVKVCVTVRDLQSCAWRPATGFGASRAVTFRGCA